MAHGPVKRDHSFDLPKKVRKLGLRHALSTKLSEGKLFVTSNLKVTHDDMMQYRSAFQDQADAEFLEQLCAAEPGFSSRFHECRSVFDEHDADGDGTLTAEQLEEACDALEATLEADAADVTSFPDFLRALTASQPLPLFKTLKTRDLVRALEPRAWPSVLFIDGEEVCGNFQLASRNLKKVGLLPQQGANVYDILRYDALVLTVDGVAAMEHRLAE